ncbi:hypothetical protein M9458_010463, partial [Cirrhinus mrigala]
MAAVSNVISFGLLYTRPLQWWLKTKRFSLRGNLLCMIKVKRPCLGHVEVTLVLVSGPGVGSSLSARNASNGHVPHRLGSGHEWPPRPRSVERSQSSLAHQLPGDAGRVSGPGLLRAGSSGAEWGPPHSTVSVSPRCPREISLPTLPVLRGAAVSSEPTPQSLLPGNVAELGSSPPLWGSLEQLVWPSPAGHLLQDTELAAQTTPEASLERLVPLVYYLAAWKLLPNVSARVLRTVERGCRQFGAPPPPFKGVFPTLVGPEQGLVMKQEVDTLQGRRPSRWSLLMTGSPGSTA